MDLIDRDELEHELEIVVVKFKRACKIVKRYNGQIEATQTRYLRAKRDNQRSFRYNLHLKIATLEGVRNAYYAYACQTGNMVEHLQTQIELLESSDTDIFNLSI